jgi:hypothetical protein
MSRLWTAESGGPVADSGSGLIPRPSGGRP